MDYLCFTGIFKPKPLPRYGLIPDEKKEDSCVKKFFTGKKGESAADKEYFCPYVYCDPDVANGRKITGVRQYGSERGKTFIDVNHEKEVKLLYGTPGKRNRKSKYDRPYFGDSHHWEMREKEEEEKRDLFKELPWRF